MRASCLAAAAVGLVLVVADNVSAQTVLVAPFANRTGAGLDRSSAALDWIGESISETVRASLDQERVSVVSREERDRYRKRLSFAALAPLTLASLIKVAEAASADMLVWGDYEVLANEAGKPPSAAPLRITVRLIQRQRGIDQLLTTESGMLEDLSTLERAIAWDLFSALRPAAKVNRAEFESRHAVRKPNAQEDYIRGLLATDAQQRHRYFTQAVRIEPGFDEALFELGMLGWQKEDFSQAAGWFGRVSTASPEYRHALFLLGCSRFHLGDNAGALAAFSEVALRLPDSLETQNNIAAAQLPLDSLAATQIFARLVAAAPGDPDYLFNYGYALWSAGEFDKAAEIFRGVLDRTPNEGDSILMLGRCLKKIGPRPGDLRVAGLQRLIEDWPAASRTAH